MEEYRAYFVGYDGQPNGCAAVVIHSGKSSKLRPQIQPKLGPPFKVTLRAKMAGFKFGVVLPTADTGTILHVLGLKRILFGGDDVQRTRRQTRP